MPAAIEEGEEPASPSFDDAAFPPSETTSTPALQILRPAPSPEPPHSAPASHPYGTKPPPLSPDADDSDSGSDYDPADSHSTLPGRGFYGVGQNETMDSVVQLDYESRTSQRKASSAGPTVSRFDQATTRPPTSSVISRNAFFHPSNTLSLLWSFAHLEGTFEVDDTLIKTAEFVQLKKELLGGLAGVGGGTLEDRKNTGGGGGGWKDWIWGSSSSASGGGTAVGGATLEERKNQTMRDASIPTFSSPPSILGVDLVLEPGESKSCTAASPHSRRFLEY